AGSPPSFRPLIILIGLRQNDNQHLHRRNSALAHTRRDQDAQARLDRHGFVVELHRRAWRALQDVVSLRQSAMVAQSGIGRDIWDVHGAGEFTHVGKRAASRTGRAGKSAMCEKSTIRYGLAAVSTIVQRSFVPYENFNA